uniref:GDNF/GAS1 domain-containing protein n=1 Tax=Gopherus agassizii TaxID=38772 RepID=A0A452IMV7_9SAUR
MILHSLASGQDPHGWRTPVDCVRANELCAAESSCSSRYRTLRQCLAGRDRNTMLANKECQAALEVLQESPLYDCRCKRGMKKELQCLQIYWSIHLGLTEGEEFYEASPYEPVTSRLSDIFRLASIFSGMDPATNSKSNHCLDAAKACNLNDNCKRLRSVYISTCSKEISATEHCNRRKCHKALRQFFDRVPSEYTYRLLFCSCKDQACAERRRQTIVPSCSYEDKEKPNCLDLRNMCRTDHLCRSARFGLGSPPAWHDVETRIGMSHRPSWGICCKSGGVRRPDGKSFSICLVSQQAWILPSPSKQSGHWRWEKRSLLFHSQLFSPCTCLSQAEEWAEGMLCWSGGRHRTVTAPHQYNDAVIVWPPLAPWQCRGVRLVCIHVCSGLFCTMLWPSWLAAGDCVFPGTGC